MFDYSLWKTILFFYAIPDCVQLNIILSIMEQKTEENYMASIM
jgi:hypothetical protein